METQNTRSTQTDCSGVLSLGNSSVTSRAFLKRAKGFLQLAALTILLVMFFMNLFRGGANEQSTAQTSQLLYKMLEMPQMGALAAGAPSQTHYTHVPRNRTAD